MLSREKLKAIEERANKATVGPWVIEPLTGKYYETVILFPLELNSGQGSICLVSPRMGKQSPRDLNEEITDGHYEDLATYYDAEFIVHAREDIPVLLRHIKEQEAIISRLKREISHDG